MLVMRRGLSRPCTIVIFALFFFAPAPMQKCVAFFSSCLRRGCLYYSDVFFGIAAQPVSALYSRDLQKKNIAPKARQVF